MGPSNRRRVLAILAGAALALSTAGVAAADTLSVPLPSAITVCRGEVATFTYSGELRRSFSDPNYADGQTVVFTIDVSSDELGPVVGSLLDDTIALPADWTSQPLGTVASDTITVQLTITGTLLGVDDFIVEFFDESMAPNPFGRVVRLTVVDCGSGTPTPTPEPTPEPTPTPEPMPTSNPTPTPTPEPPPDGEVEAGGGNLTPPPTSTLVAAPGAAAPALTTLLLVVVTGLLAATASLTRFRRHR